MRKSKTFQISFDKGMVTNLKQDSFVGNEDDPRPDQFTSVLYLENLDPNIEGGTLISRLPYQKKYINYTSSSGQVYNPYEMNNDFISGFILPEKYDNTTNFVKNNNIIQHIDTLVTANPISKRVYVVFTNRVANSSETWTDLTDPYASGSLLDSNAHRGTGIIALVPEYISGNWEYQWREPFFDNADFKGAYVLGDYRDSKVYGESVYFVTAPQQYYTELTMNTTNNITEDPTATAALRYPAWIWQRWDLTKKEENGAKLFYGLGEVYTDKEKYIKWKVKKNILQLADSTEYIFAQLVNPFWNYNLNNNEMLQSTTDVGGIKTHTFYDTIADTDILWKDSSGSNASRSGLQVIIWEEPLAYPTVTYSSRTINNGNNIAAGLQTIKDRLYAQNMFDGTEYNFTGINYINKSNAYLETIESFDDSVNKERVLINSQPYYFDFIEKDIEYRQKTFNNVLRTVLPDYISMKVPRPFKSGEKIPFVLTAKRSSGEVFIKDFTYEVLSSFNDADDYGTSLYSLDRFKPDISDNIYQFTDIRTTINDALRNNAGILQLGNRDSEGEIEEFYANSDNSNKKNDNNQEDRWRLLNSQHPYMQHTYITITIRIDSDIKELLLDTEIESLKLYVANYNPDNSKLRSVGSYNLASPPATAYTNPVDPYELDSENPDLSKYSLCNEFVIYGTTGGIDIGQDDTYTGNVIPQNGWVGDGEADEMFYAVPQVKNVTPSVIPGPNLRTIVYDDNVDTPMFYTKNTNTYHKSFCLWDYGIDSQSLTLENSGQYWRGLGAGLIEVVKGLVMISETYDENGTLEAGKVRWCAVNNGSPIPDIFPKENELQVGSEPLTALKEFRNSIFFFSNNDWIRMQFNNIYSPTDWEFVEAVKGQGCFSPKTLTETPYGVVFGGRGGLFITDGTTSQSLSEPIRSIYEYLMMGKRYDHEFQVPLGNVVINDKIAEVSSGSFINSQSDYEGQYNKFAELLYDQENDELILTTPIIRFNDINAEWGELEDRFNEYYWHVIGQRDDNVNSEYDKYNDGNTPYDIQRMFTHKLSLRFNFQNKNWRVETVTLVSNHGETDTSTNPYYISGHPNGRYTVAEPQIIEFLNILKQTDGSGDDYSEQAIMPIHKQKNYEKADRWDHNSLPQISQAHDQPIRKELITHNIGDGLNDYTLRDLTLECTPQEYTDDVARVEPYPDWRTYKYKTTIQKYNNDGRTQSPVRQKDPILEITYRKSENFDKESSTPIDLIEENMKSKAATQAKDSGGNLVAASSAAYYDTNPFKTLMQTPQGDSDMGASYPSQHMLANESLIINSNGKNKFRRMTIRIVSEVIQKLRSIRIDNRIFERRSR